VPCSMIVESRVSFRTSRRFVTATPKVARTTLGDCSHLKNRAVATHARISEW
jgi:hypothetical protein